MAPTQDRIDAAEQMSGKLSEVAYLRLSDMIASGAYPANFRLPTENMLAEQLGVSRPVIREALARLRTDGVVVSRRGSGTYVRNLAPRASEVGPVNSIQDMRHCLKFRRGLEGECCYYAALSTQADERLDLAFDNLAKSMLEGSVPPEQDFAFHLAIAQRTGNRFFESAMTAIKESVATSMNITRSFLAPQGAARVREVHEEHVAVYQAVKSGDADAARQAMHRHIDNVVARAFGTAV